MHIRRWLAVGALLVGAGRVSGQSTIEGHVRSDSTRIGVPFPFVEVAGAKRLVQGNFSGRYRVEGVPAGRYLLKARAAGFLPVELEIEVGDADTLELDLLLASDPDHQRPVAVADADNERIQAFHARKRRGVGRFIEREELARSGSAPLTAVLRRITGVQVMPLPSPCLGQVLIGSRGLGGGRSNPGQMVCRGSDGSIPLPAACYLAVYLDGARIWEYGEPDPPDLGAIATSDVEAVEVYRGANEVPHGFTGRGSRCGALFLWTRVDDRNR